MPFQHVVRVGVVIVGEHKHQPGKHIVTDAVLCTGHTDGTGKGTAGALHCHGVGL